MSKRNGRNGIRAWLITWEWVGDHAEPDRKVVAALNPRWSGTRVREHVEILHASMCYSIAEQIGHANNRRFNPYPAEFTRVHGVPWHGRIHCGHNPSLYARLVNDLRVERDESGAEYPVWSEVAVLDLEQIVRPPASGDVQSV